MATVVGLSKVLLTAVNWTTLKLPTGCKYLGYISYAGRVITNFVLKFANFRYYGNRDQSQQSLTETFK